MLLGLFQTAGVENLIELRQYAPDVQGRKPAVLHRVDDIATAGVVAPRLGQHSSQHRIIVHSVIPHFHKWRGAPRSFSCPVIRQPYSAAALPHKGGRCPAAPVPPLRRENLLSHTTRKRGVTGDGNLEIFLQIFFHALNPTFHGAADGALVHALLAGDLTVALSKDQMSVHTTALDLRQRVEGVPQPEKQLLAIHELLGAGLVQAEYSIPSSQSRE